MDLQQVDWQEQREDDEPRLGSEQDNNPLPESVNQDEGDQYGQETAVKEQKLYEYEHEMAEDLSPDRNGDTEDGTAQDEGGHRQHRDEDENPI